MKMAMDCFKAYDIRGKLGEQLNDEVAYRIGRATGQFLKAEGHPKPAVVVGGDVRETSEPLKRALASGIMDAGLEVIDIGMVGTEEIYFATKHLDVAGGVEVTASHNPIDYNGMKLVREQSKPISGDTGLNDIKALAESGEFAHCEQAGGFQSLSLTDAYVEHLLGYIDVAKLKPLKIVVNAGNGAAGHVVDALESKLTEIEFIKVHHEPDGSFPNGIPNPLLPENRSATSEAVLKHGADFGIAWDGDFDRCFLFDENGQFIEGYYIVGLLAEAFLQQQPGAKIIHDPRLTWNTQAVVEQAGGVAVMSKTGHAFIKERMRQEDAIYGGEMSAHHYFRDFAYCDSGMIPWLLIAELVSVKGQGLASMVEQAIGQFPSSGEINSRLEDPKAAIERVLNTYQEAAANIDHTDGISMCFADEQGAWRFNLRSSNTEPVVRLNVESRGNIALMEQKTEEVLAILRS